MGLPRSVGTNLDSAWRGSSPVEQREHPSPERPTFHPGPWPDLTRPDHANLSCRAVLRCAVLCCAKSRAESCAVLRCCALACSWLSARARACFPGVPKLSNPSLPFFRFFASFGANVSGFPSQTLSPSPAHLLSSLTLSLPSSLHTPNNSLLLPSSSAASSSSFILHPASLILHPPSNPRILASLPPKTSHPRCSPLCTHQAPPHNSHSPQHTRVLLLTYIRPLIVLAVLIDSASPANSVRHRHDNPLQRLCLSSPPRWPLNSSRTFHSATCLLDVVIRDDAIA